MRKLRLLALLAPALLLPAACEDSSSSSGGITFNPEAGPGFEGGPVSEAGPLPEAGPDGFVPPAPPKGVTVTVTEGLTPKKDVRVISHDATGAVTGDVKTDATGKVTLATAPSMVTVLASRGFNGTSPTPVTFAAVADGDTLVVAAPPSIASEPPTIGGYAVTLTSSPVVANAFFFDLVSGAGCSTSGQNIAGPYTIPLYADCVLAQNAVLVTASASGFVQGFAFAKNVAKPALNATTNVGPLAFTAPGTTKITATNVPANTYSEAQLYGAANGAAYRFGSRSGFLSEGGIDVSTPTGFSEAYQARVAVRSAVLGPEKTRAFVRREPTTAPATSTLAFDFATALPSITDVTLTKATPARPDVTFTSEAALTTADGAVAVLSWFPQASESTGQWTFVVPPSTTTFKAPALPADAASFAPTANVEVDSLTFFEATLLPGYKELKTLPVTPSFGVTLRDEALLLPATGTVRTSSWEPAPLRR